MARHSRYVMLAKVKNKDTESVVSALIKQSRQIPDELYRSLTWDRGKEMSDHKRFTMETNIDVYFCDPQSPWPLRIGHHHPLWTYVLGSQKSYPTFYKSLYRDLGNLPPTFRLTSSGHGQITQIWLSNSYGEKLLQQRGYLGMISVDLKVIWEMSV